MRFVLSSMLPLLTVTLLVLGLPARLLAEDGSGSPTTAWAYIGTYTGKNSKGIYRFEMDLTTGKLTGKMAAYEKIRVNPSKNVGFSALDAAAKLSVPAIFVVAENEELSNNASVAAVHQGLTERGVPARYHVIKGITHYGVYREGFAEATRVELEWLDQHLKGPSSAKSLQ